MAPKMGNLSISVVACVLPSKCDTATLAALDDPGNDSALETLVAQLDTLADAHPRKHLQVEIAADAARVPAIERLLNVKARS
jgi:hypothetical protein